jgi:hypothetical protein
MNGEVAFNSYWSVVVDCDFRGCHHCDRSRSI